MLSGGLDGDRDFRPGQGIVRLDVALLSALLWSAGTIAIMDNRLAKEDTLLVFFAWLGYYFYMRAKKASAIQVRQHAERMRNGTPLLAQALV